MAPETEDGPAIIAKYGSLVCDSWTPDGWRSKARYLVGLALPPADLDHAATCLFTAVRCERFGLQGCYDLCDAIREAVSGR